MTRNPGKTPPELEDVRGQIEDTLTQQKVDQALDHWLSEARGHARIRYFPEAFQ